MMPHDPVKTVQLRKVYWRRVERFTALLLFVWFATTFGIGFFARELAEFTVFGWPFSFYMAAQGLTLLYVVIVAVYVICMRRLDRTMKDETVDAS
jgi:putative solute:sodium symporter small subunit